MTTQEALTLIKQAIALLQKDWDAHIKLVEAVRVVETALQQSSPKEEPKPTD